jgi:hypothetical protein
VNGNSHQVSEYGNDLPIVRIYGTPFAGRTTTGL